MSDDYDYLEAQQDLSGEMRELRLTLEATNQRLQLARAGASVLNPSSSATASRATSPFGEAFPDLTPYSRQIENTFGRSLDDLISRGKSAADVFGGFYDKLTSIVAQVAIINPLLNGLFGSSRATLGGSDASSGLASGIGDFFSNLFGRAAGGPVTNGQPYLVGEHGPELFIPQLPGQIANRGAASGRPVNVTMNVQTPDVNGFRANQAQLGAWLAQAMARGQRVR